MPRLNPLPRADVSDDFTLKMYDFMFGDRDPVAEPGTVGGTPGNWWTVMAQSPAALRHAVRGFRLYRQEVQLRPEDRELGQIRAGWGVGSQFVFSSTARRAVRQDCPKRRFRPFHRGRPPIVSITKSDCCWPTPIALRDSTVGYPSNCSPNCERSFTDSEILEFTYVTTMYVMHATMSRALRLEFDDVRRSGRGSGRPGGRRRTGHRRGHVRGRLKTAGVNWSGRVQESGG